MTRRLAGGPDDDELLAVVRCGPITSRLLGERLGCSALIAGNRMRRLVLDGQAKQAISTAKSGKERAAPLWYVPGCGPPPARHRPPPRRKWVRRKPLKPAAAAVAPSEFWTSEDEAWMHGIRDQIADKKERRARMRV